MKWLLRAESRFLPSCETAENLIEALRVALAEFNYRSLRVTNIVAPLMRSNALMRSQPLVGAQFECASRRLNTLMS